jgi:hypothetical protein
MQSLLLGYGLEHESFFSKIKISLTIKQHDGISLPWSPGLTSGLAFKI